MEQKLFAKMPEDERQEWTEAYRHWLSHSLPELKKARTMTTTLRDAFEQGLALLSAFPYCRSFVAESLRFRNYASRIRPLARYADKVTADVEKMMNTKVDLSDPALLVPHVGRPTKQEADARALKAEQERKAAEHAEDTLFGKKAEIPVEMPPAPGTVSGSLTGGALLHLDQLKWLLSPTMQEAVGSVRELRTRAAEEATIAKQMAVDGKRPEEIEPHAQEAAKLIEIYESIYERVDDELARVYVRLKEDTTFITEMQEKKVNPSDLRTMLRPYWDKMEDKDGFKAQVIDFIKENDPAQAAIREQEEKKKKQIADIIKYLTRKDKPNTPKRIATMQERFAELQSLMGEEAAAYRPVLQAAIDDCNNNVLPAIQAKKAEKSGKVEAKDGADAHDAPDENDSQDVNDGSGLSDLSEGSDKSDNSDSSDNSDQSDSSDNSEK